MSFYTALTGLNAATAQLSVTSNNIANVGTAGFKRSRADFGDIFATSPLQKASSVIGQGVALKSVTQEFSQGNIQFSASSLDIAITGDGFFPLKSADGLQDVFTRNGTFLLDNAFGVVNSAGQALQAASVDSSGKADLDNLRKLIIPPKTTGDATQTTGIDLSLNLPAAGEVKTKVFDEKDPSTYNLTTAVTVFDSSGNEFLATVYYAKTQRASPDAAENKWQTHAYIGETRLDEFLVQASDSKGQKQYVNKYGQVKSEGEIPPQNIARGVTKLVNLDRLTNKQLSVSAAYEGAKIAPTTVAKLKDGTFNLNTELIAITPKNATKLAPGTDKVEVTLRIDKSPTPVKVDLSDLFTTASTATTYSGVDLARILENRVNKAYGDLGFFDLTALKNSTTATTMDLFKIKVGETERSISISGITDPTKVTVEDLTTKINAALAAAATATPPGFAAAAPTISFSPSEQKFIFKAASTTDVIQVKGFVDGSRNEVFDIPKDFTTVDKATGSYGGTVIPNGASIRSFSSKYEESDQRTGIRVRFDDTTGTFSMLSGSTGDKSSVEVVFPFATGSTTTRLTAANFEADGSGAGSEKRAFEAFRAIFNFSPGLANEELLPKRGVRSTAAAITGGPVGLNLDNKFTLDAASSVFTVTVDNVTGTIRLPFEAGREYTKESFRQLLEQRINALEDSRGRTVNGTKVAFKTVGNTTRLTITGGTEGDDSFLKMTGPSLWGLSDLAAGRGSTERWIVPPQSVNANGVPLFVDRDGNETTQAGNFSEEETRELFSPVFLDKGELTFDTAGKLVSPLESIKFKPTTIGSSGTTLRFAVNYAGSTQFSSPFSVLNQRQNGRPEGDLIGLDISDDGLVLANYSNGSQKNLAKVVLANFSAPTGLRQVGDASYLATSKSGATRLGEAGTAGFGTVRAGARERANVDLTQELIELITAQRNFQANAKAIETNNTLTQAIINIRN